MPPPDARIAEITARLAAAGLKPRRTEHSGHTTVEAAVPPSFPDESWPEVLAVLETADRFGLNSATHGRTLWAVIRSVPDPRQAPDGPPPQP